MSAENKKLVWIAVAVSIFVLVLAVAGFVFFTPKKGGGPAPAVAGNIAPPKASDPQDYLSLPAQSMPTGNAPSKEGDVIVIYGDKPQGLSGNTVATDDAAALQAAAAAASGQGNASLPAGGAVTNPAQGGTQGNAQGSVQGSSPANQAGSPVAPSASGTTKAAPVAAKPSAAKAVTSKPVAKPAKAQEQYWIQVASFSSRGKADDLKDGLGKAGMASLITVKDINGKSWYRVRIGPWPSDAEAKGWLTKIKALPGCSDSVIMKDAAVKK